MEILDKLEKEEEAHDAAREQRVAAREAHESAVRVALLRVSSGRIKKSVKKRTLRWSQALRDKDGNVKLLEAVPNKSDAELALLAELKCERDAMWQREHDASLAEFAARHPHAQIQIVRGGYWAVDRHAALLANCAM